jgi:hypothetical protein
MKVPKEIRLTANKIVKYNYIVFELTRQLYNALESMGIDTEEIKEILAYLEGDYSAQELFDYIENDYNPEGENNG